MRRADLENGAFQILGSMPHYGAVWTGIRTVAEVNKQEQGLKATEAEEVRYSRVKTGI